MESVLCPKCGIICGFPKEYEYHIREGFCEARQPVYESKLARLEDEA